MNNSLISLEVMFSGDPKYKPTGVDNKKWYRVISTYSRARKYEKDGQTKNVIDVFFYVINDEGKLVKLIDKNCFLRQLNE